MEESIYYEMVSIPKKKNNDFVNSYNRLKDKIIQDILHDIKTTNDIQTTNDLKKK